MEGKVGPFSLHLPIHLYLKIHLQSSSPLFTAFRSSKKERLQPLYLWTTFPPHLPDLLLLLGTPDPTYPFIQGYFRISLLYCPSLTLDLMSDFRYSSPLQFLPIWPQFIRVSLWQDPLLLRNSYRSPHPPITHHFLTTLIPLKLVSYSLYNSSTHNSSRYYCCPTSVFWPNLSQRFQEFPSKECRRSSFHVSYLIFLPYLTSILS